MFFFKIPFSFFPIASAVLSFFFVSCDKGEELDQGESYGADVREGDSLFSNRLKGLPGNVFTSQVSSPIHWQPFTKEALKMAKDSNRLIFAVVVMPRGPAYLDFLKILEGDASRVQDINNNYVPVLIDGSVMREMAVLTAFLCSEIGSPTDFPLFMWMSPEGNPVAWLPVLEASEEGISKVVFQSNEMLTNMWKRDQSYIVKNSGEDQFNRGVRVEALWDTTQFSADTSKDGPLGLRQLIALYDPMSRTLDDSGSVFPTGAMDLLALGSGAEGLQDRLRERAKDVLLALTEDLITSPMFDPIDGGVFSRKEHSSWGLPSFSHDCVMQAKIVRTLLNVYEVSEDERVLVRALRILKFIEDTYRSDDGLFSFSEISSVNTEDWLWEFDDLDEVLTPEQKEVWVLATGMNSTGNLTAESDPSRKYGRKNTISFVLTNKEVSEQNGMSVDEVSELVEEARMKLSVVRKGRMPSLSVGKDVHAESTFYMVSAYASAYRVTGNDVFLARAVDTLSSAREAFFKGIELSAYKKEGVASSLIAGRAMLYATALNSVLDVYSITLDEKWLMWADDIADISAEKFNSEVLRECDPDAAVIDLEVFDFGIFPGESTMGAFSMAEARLSALGFPVFSAFSEKCKVLPLSAIQKPVTFSDMISSSIVRDLGCKYIYGPDVSEKMKSAISRTPLELFAKLQINSKSKYSQEVKRAEVIRVDRNGDIVKIEKVEKINVPLLLSE